LTTALADACFNGFDVALCDALPEACLREGAAVFFALAAFVPPVFAARAFAAFGERSFGGFLARFLGHTPSFRRFRRLNQ
jgi:hypothetical protein